MADRRMAQPLNYDYYYEHPYSRQNQMAKYHPRTRSVDRDPDDKRSYDHDIDQYSRRRGRSDERHNSSRHRKDRHGHSSSSSSRSHHHHHHHHHHSSRDEHSPRRSSRRSHQSSGAARRKDANSGDKKLHHVATAALDAAAVEAVRIRKQPGEWAGSKGVRVATAALGAAAIGSAQDTDTKKHSKRHLVEATVGGLLANRAVNGSRDEMSRRH